MKEKTPIKITPDPIINAVIEVRFKPGILENAVFGSIYNKLNKKYPVHKNLDIGIPYEMRKALPNFQYQVEAEISNEDYIIGIGSNVISFKIQGEYKGWGHIYSNFKDDFNILLKEDNLIAEVERVGLRYINFFKNEKDIFNSFKLTIDFGNKEDYKINSTSYSTNLLDGDVFLTLRVADKVKTKDSEKGLLLDIDAYKNNDLDKNNIVETVNALHITGEKLFFRLLEKDFLNKFKPEYKE